MAHSKSVCSSSAAAFFAAVADFFDVIVEFTKSDKQSGVNSAIAKWERGVVEEWSAVGIDCRMALKEQCPCNFQEIPQQIFFIIFVIEFTILSSRKHTQKIENKNKSNLE